MSQRPRERARRACGGCMAQIDARALRCRWCGAASESSGATGPRPGLLPSKSQDFRHWDEKRSTIEMTVDPTSSHESTVVQAGGGQPTESPSRTTGTPSTTK